MHTGYTVLHGFEVKDFSGRSSTNIPLLTELPQMKSVPLKMTKNRDRRSALRPPPFRKLRVSLPVERGKRSSPTMIG